MPASAAADEVVRSGPLRATVHADPWRIELTGPAGRSVVDQPLSADAGTAGNLGFHTATGWARAVRATSIDPAGKGLRAIVATDDPLGGTLDVSIAPAGQDSIRVTATAVTAASADSTSIAFGIEPGERFTGFGERSNFVDARGPGRRQLRLRRSLSRAGPATSSG